MQQKTPGIVLHSLKYGDHSLIVKILTCDFGLKSFMVRGFRGKKSAMQASLFMPLTKLQLDISQSKTASNFSNIKDVQCIDPMHSLHTDFNKQALAQFIAEVLYKTIADEEPHPELFEFIDEVLGYLNTTAQIPSAFAQFFMVNYSRYLGLYPNIHSEEETMLFDMRNGVFTNEEDLHSEVLSAPESASLKAILNASIENLHEVKIANSVRKKLLLNLIQYYKIHLLNFREINSHLILAEVLRG